MQEYINPTTLEDISILARQDIKSTLCLRFNECLDVTSGCLDSLDRKFTPSKCSNKTFCYPDSATQELRGAFHGLLTCLNKPG
jgi:hypothetical protein